MNGVCWYGEPGAVFVVAAVDRCLWMGRAQLQWYAGSNALSIQFAECHSVITCWALKCALSCCWVGRLWCSFSEKFSKDWSRRPGWHGCQLLLRQMSSGSLLHAFVHECFMLVWVVRPNCCFIDLPFSLLLVLHAEYISSGSVDCLVCPRFTLDVDWWCVVHALGG